MLFGKLQLGLPDLLLQIGSCCADLIADDIVLADSSGLLQNIPDELADHGIHLFGTVGRGAITVLFVLGTVIAFALWERRNQTFRPRTRAAGVDPSVLE